MSNALKKTDLTGEVSTASLSTFFSKTPVTDLNSCDQEQVHLSGSIQNEGALLVVTKDTLNVVACSRNMAELLGVADVDFMHCSLNELDNEPVKDLVADLEKLNIAEEGVHSVLDTQVDGNGETFDMVVHSYRQRWVIEFMPTFQLDAREVRRGMRVVSRESGRIISTVTLDEALQIGCDATRDITGFSRVKIYQFLPDWSGKVVAESRAEHMQSFLGLHFPDTDIPRQARALYELVPYRAIFNVHDRTHDIEQHARDGDTPLDLSCSLLRSVSTMHTCYLRNMGVEASLSISLFLDGKLWGLIACHHDEPRALPFDIWTSLRELGLALSNRIAYEVRRSTSNKVLDLRKIEVNLASKLREKGNLMDVVEEFGPSLMRFMNADGFAFQYGEQIHLTGHTPPKEFLPELIQWVQTEADEWEQYQTCSLHKQWPGAEPFKDSACGVLLQPVALHRTCQMVWFRKPLGEKVSWAGELTDKFDLPAEKDTSALLPRNSFAAWVGEHNDFCQPWTDAELVIAREILREILDILASVLMLAEENSRLKSFAASAAAHDIKGPLRQIEMALSIMEEDDFNIDAIREWHDVATDSTRILKNVATGILEYMSLPDSAHAFYKVDLKEVFDDVKTVIATQVAHNEATVSINIDHQILGEKNLITSLFLNLIYNALNYNIEDQNAEVNVNCVVVEDKWVEVSVEDNGLGIPVEYAEQVFNPSERLKEKEGVEGSGLGLSICRRIVNIHKGTIHVDTDYTDGARIVVRLPRAMDAME